MSNKPIIKDSFTNKRGIYFDKVKEISYTRETLGPNIGKFITQTKLNSGVLANNSFPVYIYQSHSNPNIGHRLYQNLYDYNFNGNNDDILIQRLQEKQSQIKRTEFPTAVLTIDGSIVGQEIPYYENSIALSEFFKKYKDFDPTKIYYVVLEILNELEANGIIYLDIHSRNFLIDPTSKDLTINLIDFDNTYIGFDNSDFQRESLFQYIIEMLNKLNLSYGFGEQYKFTPVKSFDEAYQQVETMKRKLIK